MEGSIPLSTLRCKVEYGFTEASTPQGNIGIKVWVNNGRLSDGGDRPMPQMPKRVKYRKSQRGSASRGNAHDRGNYVAYGDYGLQTLEGGWLSPSASRRAASP